MATTTTPSTTVQDRQKLQNSILAGLRVSPNNKDLYNMFMQSYLEGMMPQQSAEEQRRQQWIDQFNEAKQQAFLTNNDVSSMSAEDAYNQFNNLGVRNANNVMDTSSLSPEESKLYGDTRVLPLDKAGAEYAANKTQANLNKLIQAKQALSTQGIQTKLKSDGSGYEVIEQPKDTTKPYERKADAIDYLGFINPMVRLASDATRGGSDVQNSFDKVQRGILSNKTGEQMDQEYQQKYEQGQLLPQILNKTINDPLEAIKRTLGISK